MSLMSVVFVYLAVLCAVIKGQGIGYAEHTFDDVGVEIIIQINANQVINIEICGHSDAWFGVGFNGALMMDVTDALVITNDGSTATVKEYNLNDHALGDLHPVPQYTLRDALFSNDELCVFVERSTTVTATGYFDFPTTFATDTQSHHDIIVARGGSTTISKHSVTASTTLFYQEGIRTTATPTAVPSTTPSEAPTEGELITKDSINEDSAICFASDSYVLTYPDFKRTLVKDLKIYDKMLTYDELEGTFFWDELLVKIHFEEGEFLNDVLVEMREFVLSNGERLTMSHNHLLFVGQSGLQRADHVRLGDKLKVFDGSYADVIGIEESVKRYGRNLITYNGNLVINGVAISTFTESIWGESPSWGKWLRHVMKYGYSYDVWRMPAYWTAKVWTDYASVGFKDAVLRFYFDEETEVVNENGEKTNWFIWWLSLFSRHK
eukprot:455405_1